MQVYIIRHTSVNVAKDLFYGQTDVPLADTFESEAAEVAKKLTGIKPDAIYASPLTRCRRLAENVVGEQKIIFDDRLKELNFGDWEMGSWKQIKGLTAETWYKNFVDTKCPNGESYMQLRDRVADFINFISKQNHEIVFVFTHAGIIRSAINIFDKVELKDTFKGEMHYGVVFKYEI